MSPEPIRGRGCHHRPFVKQILDGLKGAWQGKQPPAPFSPMLIAALTTFLFMNPLLGDSIGNVHYDLPPSKQHWKLAAEKTTDNEVVSRTRRYVPETRGSVAIAQEDFNANINNLPENPLENEAAIQQRIQKMFPEMKIDVHMVQQSPKSHLYTWSITSDVPGKLSFWGVSKHFYIDKGTVNLMYKTTNKELFDAGKNDWIEALKTAHIQEDGEKNDQRKMDSSGSKP